MFGLREIPIVASLSGLLVSAGGPVILAGFVRAQGLERQKSLVKKWGGWPTSQRLAVVSAERRARLESVTGFPLPEQTTANLDVYGEITGVLIAKTRDTDRFRLLFEENRNYGFERNLLGVKPIGISVSVLTLVLALVATVLLARSGGATSAEHVAGLVVLLLIVLFWVFYPSESRAKELAFKYADRLIEASDELPQHNA